MKLSQLIVMRYRIVGFLDSLLPHFNFFSRMDTCNIMCNSIFTVENRIAILENSYEVIPYSLVYISYIVYLSISADRM